VIELPISVLDLVLIQSHTTADQALVQMVTFARRAERWGFHRFWVAEHHGSPAVASNAPPILVARLAAETSAIRVGSGGVMLPNHSPVVVAEQFGSLGALDPGRIDLGVGRGPGAVNPDYVALLRRGAPPASDEEYAGEIGALLRYFTAEESRAVRVSLAEGYAPQIWLLASSEAGAGLAARFGLPLSFAHHIKPENTASALALYRERFQPSRWLDHPYAMVSVQVVCADTDEKADAMARPAELLQAQLVSGQAARLLTPEEAAGHRFTQKETEFIATRRNGQAQGSPQKVGKQLAALVGQANPDELMVMTPVYDLDDRLRSFELLTEQVLSPQSPGSLTGR
jgi:luciferase family oxidoreductase group 1